MRTRYAVTVDVAVPSLPELPGWRQLAWANQGRNHWDTREQAERWLREAWKNSEPAIRQVFGNRADTLGVDEIECHDSGDAVGIYVQRFLDHGAGI